MGDGALFNGISGTRGDPVLCRVHHANYCFHYNSAPQKSDTTLDRGCAVHVAIGGGHPAGSDSGGPNKASRLVRTIHDEPQCHVFGRQYGCHAAHDANDNDKSASNEESMAIEVAAQVCHLDAHGTVCIELRKTVYGTEHAWWTRTQLEQATAVSFLALLVFGFVQVTYGFHDRSTLSTRNRTVTSNCKQE